MSTMRLLVTKGDTIATRQRPFLTVLSSATQRTIATNGATVASNEQEPIMKTTKIHNNTKLDRIEERILGLRQISWGKSYRQGRDIQLFQHPHKADWVISVGATFDHTMIVYADEPKSAWAKELGMSSPWETH
jgi:hypothetical protein